MHRASKISNDKLYIISTQFLFNNVFSFFAAPVKAVVSPVAVTVLDLPEIVGYSRKDNLSTHGTETMGLTSNINRRRA